MASGVYPHQSASWLRFLGTPPDWEKIVAAFARWDSGELEEAANAQGLPLTIARTPQEWLEHPHGALLASKPVIEIEKIGDGDPQPFAPSERPLSGVRVLSFTHAVAGPTVGRTLAEQGADVLNVTYPNHFEHDFIYNEANVGSRSTTLDLQRPRAPRSRRAARSPVPMCSSTTTVPGRWPLTGSTRGSSLTGTPGSSACP